MKRRAEESSEQGNTNELEGREQKRQKEDDPIESENTGGASSSKDCRNLEGSEDQQVESAKNKSVPDVKGPSRKEREEHEETHCTHRS